MRLAVILVFVLLAAGWLLTSPGSGTDSLPSHTPDPENGEAVFWAGGCASCHATPVAEGRPQGNDKLLLGGGLELETVYGVFRVPNISPHPDAGIGAWSDVDFVNAMQHGISPAGFSYYPSFPYTSYARMTVQDVLDLKAYLDALPAVSSPSVQHALGFPWSVRRGVGLWQRLYLDTAPIIGVAEDNAALQRGRALVEGVGHCGECHTPRNALGAMNSDRWLAGASNPDGPGRIPNITPGAADIADWSESDLAYYFESGFTPDWDTVGGSMVAVQENLARLSDADRRAIAAYLKAVPAISEQE
ncbi:MAG: cytochrome c [Pseudomonadota bacterium]